MRTTILKCLGIGLAILLLSAFISFDQVKGTGLAEWEKQYKNGWFPRLELTHRGVAYDKAITMIKTVSESIGLPRPTGLAIVSIFLFQNLILLLLSYQYMRRMHLSPIACLLGLSALAWILNHLASPLDPYFFCILMLLTLYAISAKYYWFIPLIAVIEVLTTGFFPFSLLLLLTHTKSLNTPALIAMCISVPIGIFYMTAYVMELESIDSIDLTSYEEGEIRWHYLLQVPLNVLPIIVLSSIRHKGWPRQIKSTELTLVVAFVMFLILGVTNIALWAYLILVLIPMAMKNILELTSPAPEPVEAEA